MSEEGWADGKEAASQDALLQPMPPTNTLAENFSFSVWDPKGFYDLQTTLHLKPLRETEEQILSSEPKV